jgi:threonine synthase
MKTYLLMNDKRDPVTLVACEKCAKPYPTTQTPFKCECGGLFDFVNFPTFTERSTKNGFRSMWKFQSSLGLQDNINPVTLDEGGIPLISALWQDNEVFLKMESENPTGSYKDRGTSVLINFLKSRGVEFAIEDSSGNAGASFAAYCAKARINCRVYIPESASGPKKNQIEMFGAELVRVPGPRAEAAKAVMEAAQRGAVYASHAYMPFGLTGIATIAYELIAQLGCIPKCVIAPVGHGGLLYGIMLGFEAMVHAGAITQVPYYYGVQSEGCAPLYKAYTERMQNIPEVTQTDTVAEGVRVANPARGNAILKRMFGGGGEVLTVREKDLKLAYFDLAKKGFYTEPTSALVWAAMDQIPLKDCSPTVAIITGSGYKSNQYLTME